MFPESLISLREILKPKVLFNTIISLQNISLESEWPVSPISEFRLCKTYCSYINSHIGKTWNYLIYNDHRNNMQGRKVHKTTSTRECNQSGQCCQILEYSRRSIRDGTVLLCLFKDNMYNSGHKVVCVFTSLYCWSDIGAYN